MTGKPHLPPFLFPLLHLEGRPSPEPSTTSALNGSRRSDFTVLLLAASVTQLFQRSSQPQEHHPDICMLPVVPTPPLSPLSLPWFLGRGRASGISRLFSSWPTPPRPQLHAFGRPRLPPSSAIARPRHQPPAIQLALESQSDSPSANTVASLGSPAAKATSAADGSPRVQMEPPPQPTPIPTASADCCPLSFGSRLLPPQPRLGLLPPWPRLGLLSPRLRLSTVAPLASARTAIPSASALDCCPLGLGSNCCPLGLGSRVQSFPQRTPGFGSQLSSVPAPEAKLRDSVPSPLPPKGPCTWPLPPWTVVPLALARTAAPSASAPNCCPVSLGSDCCSLGPCLRGLLPPRLWLGLLPHRLRLGLLPLGPCLCGLLPPRPRLGLLLLGLDSGQLRRVTPCLPTLSWPGMCPWTRGFLLRMKPCTCLRLPSLHEARHISRLCLSEALGRHQPRGSSLGPNYHIIGLGFRQQTRL